MWSTRQKQIQDGQDQPSGVRKAALVGYIIWSGVNTLSLPALSHLGRLLPETVSNNHLLHCCKLCQDPSVDQLSDWNSMRIHLISMNLWLFPHASCHPGSCNIVVGQWFTWSVALFQKYVYCCCCCWWWCVCSRVYKYNLLRLYKVNLWFQDWPLGTR